MVAVRGPRATVEKRHRRSSIVPVCCSTSCRRRSTSQCTIGARRGVGALRFDHESLTRWCGDAAHGNGAAPRPPSDGDRRLLPRLARPRWAPPTCRSCTHTPAAVGHASCRTGWVRPPAIYFAGRVEDMPNLVSQLRLTAGDSGPEHPDLRWPPDPNPSVGTVSSPTTLPAPTSGDTAARSCG